MLTSPENALVTGTRFWGNSEGDLSRLDTFVQAALEVSDLVLVAVRSDADQCDTVEHLKSIKGTEAIPVRPWGFAPALNALISHGLKTHRQMLMASIEYPPLPQPTHELQSLAVGQMVYAGAVLEDHEFHPGTVPAADASQVPRNTFAVVQLPLLGITGVPPIVDCPENPEMAGMEEVVTLAMQQLIGNSSCLVDIPKVTSQFNTEGWDEERLAKHRKKIQSKIIRANYQLDRAGLSAPRVTHIA